MIDPTPADIGRRVRMWIPAERREVLGNVTRIDPTYVWVRYDGDPIARATIRDILTWVRS